MVSFLFYSQNKEGDVMPKKKEKRKIGIIYEFMNGRKPYIFIKVYFRLG